MFRKKTAKLLQDLSPKAGCRVEKMVYAWLTHQYKISLAIQRWMNGLSQRQRILVWAMYFAGFTACLSLVIVKPFREENAVSLLIPNATRLLISYPPTPLLVPAKTHLVFGHKRRTFSACFDQQLPPVPRDLLNGNFLYRYNSNYYSTNILFHGNIDLARKAR